MRKGSKFVGGPGLVGLGRWLRPLVLLGGMLGVSAASAANVDLGLTQCLANPNPGIRGGEITFTLNYSNNATLAAAAGVEISIPLPATTTYVPGSASVLGDGSGGASCSHSGVPGTLTCTLGGLSGSGTGSVVMKLTTSAGTGASISSAALISVAAADTDTDAGNNGQSCSASINDGADLSLSISGAPDPVPGGGQATWSVNGSNSGPDAAVNPRFITTLPGTLSYVSSSGSGWSCAAAGQTVTCNRSSNLASGSAYPALSLVTQLAAGVESGTVTVNGSISSPSTGDPNSINNTGSASVNVAAGADLQVTLPPLGSVEPGATVNYPLTVRNNGPSDAATGATVTFQLPAGFVPGPAPAPAGWNCSWGGQLLTCDHPGSFPKNQEAAITVTATAPNVAVPTSYGSGSENLATVAANAGGPTDPVSSNNTAQRTLLVMPNNAVHLSLQKTKAPSPVAVGAQITSTLRVCNTVDTSVTPNITPTVAAVGSITLDDILVDASETFVSSSGSWTCAAPQANTPTAGKSLVSCTNTSTLNVGSCSNLTIVTQANQSGSLTNEGRVYHPGNWHGDNNVLKPATVTATAVVNSPNLSLVKTANTLSQTLDGTRKVLLNSENTLTYVLQLTNLGDKDGNDIDATDIVITDPIPAYRAGATSFNAVGVSVANANGSSATFNCTTGATVTCTQTGGVLKKNDTVTISIPVNRPLNDGNFTNAASAYSTTQGDPVRANNDASALISIQPLADLEMVSKVVSPNPVAAGTEAEYVLSFRNAGPSSSQNVVVKDVFTVGVGQPGFTFVSVSNNAGASCSGLTPGQNYNTPGTYTLSCSGFNLSANASRTVTIRVRPNWQSGSEGSASLSNQAYIYSDSTAEVSTDTALGDPGVSVTRGSQANFRNLTLNVTNAGLNMLIETDDLAPAGPDPLGYSATGGGDNPDNDITYRVRMVNQGPSLATGLSFTYAMTPPAGKVMKFMGDTTSVGGGYGSAICNNIGNSVTGPATLTITCTYPTGAGADQLASSAGSNERIHYLVFRALSAPDAMGYTVQTLATVHVNEIDSNPADDTEPESTTIKIRADLEVLKSVDRPNGAAGDTLVFTVLLNNKGPGNAADILVADLLPSGFTYVSHLASQGSYVPGTGIWNVGAVNNGQSANLKVTATLLAAGNHVNVAAVTQSSLPDPVPGNNSDTETVTVVPLASIGSISGKVYLDANGNGLFDGSDAGIAAQTLNLTGYEFGANGLDDGGAGDDQPVARSVVTDNNGDYSFAGLLQGRYTVTQPLQPAGTQNGITTPGAVPGGTVGVGTATGVTPSAIAGIVLPAGVHSINNNFGEVKPAVISRTIAGKVFLDRDDNGLPDGGDVGYGSQVIRLTGTSSSGTPVDMTVLTAADGSFIFENVPEGANYTLTQPAQPAGSKSGKTTPGTAGGTATTAQVSPSVISGINLSGTQTASLNNWFGEVEAGRTVSGMVFLDRDNNGVVDTTDAGIAGQEIRLSGTDVHGNPVNLSTLTGSDGRFVFVDVPEGSNYTLTQPGQPAGTENGKTIPGSTGGTGTSVQLTPSVISGLRLDGSRTLSVDNLFAEIPGQGPDLTLSKKSLSERFVVGGEGSYLLVVRNAGSVATSGTIAVSDNLPAGLVLRGSASGSGWVCQGSAQLLSCSSSLILAPGAEAPAILVPVQVVGQLAGQVVVNTATVSGGGEQEGVKDNNAGSSSTPVVEAASLQGTVWRDMNHDRVLNTGEPRMPGWVVELLLGDAVVKTTVTDAQGEYKFSGLVPGAGYSVRFREPGSGVIYGKALPNERGLSYVDGVVDAAANPAGAVTTDGFLSSLTLQPGSNTIEQSLPLDPSGVVYDAVSRAPVTGAVVSISGPPGFGSEHVIGGNLSVVTGSDGFYQFLLLPGAPAGVYTLTVVPPGGYLPTPSGLIPVCSNTLQVSALPDPALVQSSPVAPAVGVAAHDPAACPGSSSAIGSAAASTLYYFSFALDGDSANLVNNHIPLDPLTGAIVVTKTTPLMNVSKGGLVPYVVTATNTLNMVVPAIEVVDRMPPGFKYRQGSARVAHGGSSSYLKLEPEVLGRHLKWRNLSFAAGETKTFRLVLLVGAGVGEGEYDNLAWADSSPDGGRLSNVASAQVRVVPDPTFDCSDIIGKVFDDKNANGYQDQGEPGIANVRMATARGLLVTSDAEGRFHVACAAIPQADRGSNFVMKLDERTLPSGYRVTTENPRDVRLTRGKMVKLNFGATVHKVLRLELDGRAFVAGKDELLPEWQQRLPAIVHTLQAQPSVLRLAYRAVEGDLQGKARMKALEERIGELYQEASETRQGVSPSGNEDGEPPEIPPLLVETEVFNQVREGK